MFVTIYEFIKQCKHENLTRRMTFGHKLAWVFANVNVGLALFITFFYWSFLDGDRDKSNWTPVNRYWNIYHHSLNGALALIDTCVVARPWRMHHYYQPFLVGVWYALFSLVYYYAGGTDANGNAYIYKPLDWSDPGKTAGIVVGCFAALFAIHLIVNIAFSCIHLIDETLKYIYEHISHYRFTDYID